MEEFGISLDDYRNVSDTRSAIDDITERWQENRSWDTDLVILTIFSPYWLLPLSPIYVTLALAAEFILETFTAYKLLYSTTQIIIFLCAASYAAVFAWHILQPALNIRKKRLLEQWEATVGSSLREKLASREEIISLFELSLHSHLSGMIQTLYDRAKSYNSSSSEDPDLLARQFIHAVDLHKKLKHVYLTQQPKLPSHYQFFADDLARGPLLTVCTANDQKGGGSNISRKKPSKSTKTSLGSGGTLTKDDHLQIPRIRGTAQSGRPASRSLWPKPSDFTPVVMVKPPVLPSAIEGHHSNVSTQATSIENSTHSKIEHDERPSSVAKPNSHLRELYESDSVPLTSSIERAAPYPEPPTPSSSTSAHPRQQVARVVDWEEVDHRRRSIGAEGERIALDFEINRLLERFRADLAHQVRHVSAEDGDGLGYDILSFNADGTQRFIEVKSTTDSQDAPFFMSQRELEHILANQSNSFIYHVLLNRNQPELSTIRIYPAVDVLDFRRVPTLYKVDPRSIRFGQT